MLHNTLLLGTLQYCTVYNAIHYNVKYNAILLESIHCTESPSNAPQAWFFNCTLTGFKKGSFVAQFFMRFLHSVTNCLATKQPNRALRNIPRKTTHYPMSGILSKQAHPSVDWISSKVLLQKWQQVLFTRQYNSLKYKNPHISIFIFTNLVHTKLGQITESSISEPGGGCASSSISWNIIRY